MVQVGEYGHRLLFHWGFNSSPKEHTQLKNQAEKSLEEYIGKLPDQRSLTDADGKFLKRIAIPADLLPPFGPRHNPPEAERRERYEKYMKDEKPRIHNEEMDSFWKHLLKLHRERNRTLINAVESSTGIPAARGLANGLATLIYDVHMLSDYTTTNTSALPSIKRLEDDIINLGMSRLIYGRGSQAVTEPIAQAFKKAAATGRGRTNRIRAQNLLEAIKLYLPQVLHKKFRNTLEVKGIYINVPEQSQEHK